MTREEAAKILCAKGLNGRKKWEDNWIDVFESLGMLKLEQQQEDTAKNDLLAHMSTFFPLHLSMEVIDFMTKGGFKVVKTQQENLK